MNYQTIVATAAHILTNAPQQGIMLWGAPGCGKSHAATVGLRDALGLPQVDVKHPDSGVIMFRPSNHDPVDVTGLPTVTANGTTWSTPDFLLRVNAVAERHGRALFVIDELNQAVPMMFNTLNGLILDRFVGNFKLHPGVHIVATGNRQTDKAASNRMPSHTANRLFHMDMESDLNGWTEWAIDAGLPMWVVAFVRFKPGLLNDFNADRRENPTERTWEMFARAAGDDCPVGLTFTLAKGFLGEGVAAEVQAFRQIMEEMPNPDAVMLDPKGSPVPDSLGAKYALCGALAQRVNKTNFESLAIYADRLPPEFGVLAVRDAYRLKPEVASCKAFIQWASKNSGVFV